MIHAAETLLGRALDLLEEGDVHCVGAIARDSRGRKVPADSPYAVAWDVHGLLLRAANLRRFPDGTGAVIVAADALHDAAVGMGYRTARELSDALGRDGTVALYRRALASHLKESQP